MNILLISTTCLPVPPSTYGGLESVVYDLAEVLSRMNHEVAVACPIESKLPEGVTHIPTVSCYEYKWNENLALMEYIDRVQDYDIVHDHSHQKLVYLLFRKNEDSFSYLSTLHCPDSILYPVLNPCLVTISRDHQWRIYNKYGYTSNVVYNGIDVERYIYSEDKSNRYICLGRPNRHKGTLTAIKYCKELDVPLDVVGGLLEEAPTDYAVQVARECLLGSKWKYHGSVSHDTKAKLLSQAKALIFPFSDDWNEPFGLTVIEALASGTPIVTWNRGVFRETIIHGKTGYLANNEEEFKQYMLEVDNINPEDCRRDALARWTRERMTSDYLALYNRVLAGEKW